MKRYAVAMAMLVAASLAAEGVRAQESAVTDGSSSPERPSTSATRAAGTPVVDGRLDDDAWRDAPALGGFLQRTPRDGEPATEPTEVRVLYDDQALYVAVWAYDDQPAAIVPGESIRDYDLAQSDAVLLVLDTFRDGKNGFVFGTNPAGIEYDGQIVNQGEGAGRQGQGNLTGQRMQIGSGGGFNLNWDGSWTVGATRDERGWYAEFRIPFSTLRYAGGSVQDWGFNVARRIRRTNEESFWSPISREFDLYRVSEAGTLVGIRPPAGRSARVTPYVLGSTSRDYQAGQTAFDQTREIGGDAKVQMTSSLTLDMTYNTDFAQVEVDDVQTNLTRFDLFFPEKRPFFLENAGFFSVGTSETELFFSRRIGISGDGAPVPIRGGGRVSGKAAGVNMGLLYIRTQGLEGIESGSAFSVARLARELPNRSSVGGLFVERDALETGGDANRTYAVDGKLGIGQAVTITSFVAQTDTPGPTGRDEAFHIDGALLTREWEANLEYHEVGYDFNPGVGFLPRVGYRRYSARALQHIFPEHVLGLREIRPHFQYNAYRDLDTGFEETARLHVDSHFEWPNGTLFSPAMNWDREGLEEPFEIAEGIVVPPGTYDGWAAAWHFYTNQAAPMAVEARLDWGSLLSGTRHGGSVLFTVRNGSSLSTAVRFEYNDVNLAQGAFITRLAGLRLGYFFTPRVFLQSLVQYSDQADAWSANVRFGWLNTAGTGLFIVFNDSHGVDALEGPLNRALVIKYSRQLNVWGSG
jgi:hypothetical protein